jgi:hypothetical protein
MKALVSSREVNDNVTAPVFSKTRQYLPYLKQHVVKVKLASSCKLYATSNHYASAVLDFTVCVCFALSRSNYYEVWLLNNETAFAAPELLPAAPNRMHGY